MGLGKNKIIKWKKQYFLCHTIFISHKSSIFLIFDAYVQFVPVTKIRFFLIFVAYVPYVPATKIRLNLIFVAYVQFVLVTNIYKFTKTSKFGTQTCLDALSIL